MIACECCSKILPGNFYYIVDGKPIVSYIVDNGVKYPNPPKDMEYWPKIRLNFLLSKSVKDYKCPYCNLIFTISEDLI